MTSYLSLNLLHVAGKLIVLTDEKLGTTDRMVHVRPSLRLFTWLNIHLTAFMESKLMLNLLWFKFF